jgi:hypothetical protein
MPNTLNLSDNEKINLLIDAVNEKLANEDIEFECVSLSEWDELIDDEMLQKLSLTRDDLQMEVGDSEMLKNLADTYIEQNLEDATRLVGGMRCKAGDGFSDIALSFANVIILYSVISGFKFNLNNKDGKLKFSLDYKQSQSTINKMLDIFKSWKMGK